MKDKVLRGSIIAAIALAMGGCSLLEVGGETRGASNGLIPPSAQPNYAPIQAPTYPPMPGYNTNPNLMAQPALAQPQRVNTMVIDKVEVSGMRDHDRDPECDVDLERLSSSVSASRNGLYDDPDRDPVSAGRIRFDRYGRDDGHARTGDDPDHRILSSVPETHYKRCYGRCRKRLISQSVYCFLCPKFLS